MSKEKRLGRGLEALLGRMAQPAAVAAPPGDAIDDPYRDRAEVRSAIPSGPAVVPVAPNVPPAAVPPRVPIRLIDSNPFQPRKSFDEAELQSLADSLRAHGQLQPIVVRKTEGGRYQLIAGERRLRAAAKAGWLDIQVQVIEADDRELAELAIVENLQREDLNPLEKAASFQRYLEQYGCTQEELASRLKLDRSTIANLIRLLELPEPVKDAVRQGKITQGHARSLLPLGEEREQVTFCERIQKEGLSVRQTEALVRETIDRTDAEPLAVVDERGQVAPARSNNEQVAALEQEFRAALGMKVKLVQSARGRGKLTINFSNHEEFERLRRHVCNLGQKTLKGHVG